MRRSREIMRLVAIAGIAHPSLLFAQERETLLGANAEIVAAWGVQSDITGIQDDVSATLGAFAGVTVAGTTTVVLSLASNVTHPSVNYGYFGVLARHVLRPEEALHGGASLLVAFAGTKDYEQEKSGPMDNFGNTSGEGFGFLEPGVFGEVNLTGRLRLRAGLGYRFVWGFDATTPHTALTGVTADDFSGLSLTVGVGS